MIKRLIYLIIFTTIFSLNIFADIPTWLLNAPEITVTSTNSLINVRVPTWKIDSDIEVEALVDEQVDWCLTTNNAIYLVWLAAHSNQYQIYMALFEQPGKLAWQKKVYERKIPQSELSCITMPNNNLLIFWQTYNSRTESTNIWSLLLTESGIPVWKAPFPISTRTENQKNFQVGYDPKGQILAVWQDNIKNNVKIMYQKLDETGLPLGTEDGIMLEKIKSAILNTNDFGKHKTIEKISWWTYNNNSRQSSMVEVAAQELLLPEPAFNLFLGIMLYRCFKRRN